MPLVLLAHHGFIILIMASRFPHDYSSSDDGFSSRGRSQLTKSVSQWTKSMGDESDDDDDDVDDDDDCVVVGVKEAPAKSTNDTDDDNDDILGVWSPKKAPGRLKIGGNNSHPVENNLLENKSSTKMLHFNSEPKKESSRREVQWRTMYDRAVSEYNNGFAKLKSTSTLYHWLYKMKGKVDDYNRLVGGGRKEQFDERKANNCIGGVNSEKVAMLLPLLKALKEWQEAPRVHSRSRSSSFDGSRSRSLDGSRSSHSRSRNVGSARAAHCATTSGRNRDAFDFSDVAKIQRNCRCRNHRNQLLYSSLVDFADYRFGIGLARRNMGHFQCCMKRA